MSQIVYSSIGFVAGIFLSVLVYYFAYYRKFKDKLSSIQEVYEKRLTQCQEALGNYKEQLTELEDEKSSLTGQLQTEQQKLCEEQKIWQEERHDLLIKRAEQESAALLEQTLVPPAQGEIDTTVHWQEERQNWIAEKEHLNHELEQLQQEKDALEIGVKQASERRKQEREQLQQNLTTAQREIDQLQQNLANTQQEIEQLQLQNKSLHEQKQILQDELKTQRETPAEASSEKAHSENQTDWEAELQKRLESWRRERRTLHVQITKAQADKKMLEARLVELRVQTEKERQALEEEIEQLMDRMIKLQLENEEYSS